jgi:hypothetical protein
LEKDSKNTFILELVTKFVTHPGTSANITNEGSIKSADTEFSNIKSQMTFNNGEMMKYD